MVVVITFNDGLEMQVDEGEFRSTDLPVLVGTLNDMVAAGDFPQSGADPDPDYALARAVTTLLPGSRITHRDDVDRDDGVVY